MLTAKMAELVGLLALADERDRLIAATLDKVARATLMNQELADLPNEFKSLRLDCWPCCCFSISVSIL